MKKRRILVACLTLLSLCPVADAQTAGRANVSEEAESLRRMLAHQPNHTARQRFFFSEGFGGFGANSKVAKLGNRHVEVTDDTIFIHEPGKPSIKVFPKRREYAELSVGKGFEFAVTPEELAGRKDVSFNSSGTEKVGKYVCVKIEVAYTDAKLKEMKFLFWASPELKNLIVKSEISLGEKVKFLTVLEDISLDADEELFRIPAGYKKVIEPDYLKELEEGVRKPR